MASPNKTSPHRINVAVRRGKALQLRATGITFEQIKEQLGYKTRAAAVQDVQRAMLLTVAEPAAEVRALEVARLDMLWLKAMQVLARHHVTVSNGKVVHLDGVPVLDDGPVLAAIRELRQISESRRKLLGLDAPAKVEVITDDAIDDEIRKLTAELEQRAAAEAAAATGAEDPAR